MNTARMELRWVLVGLFVIGAVGLLLPWTDVPFTGGTASALSAPIGGRSVLVAMIAGGVVAALTGANLPERLGLWLAGAASIVGAMFAVTMTMNDTFAIGHVVTGVACMGATALVFAEIGHATGTPSTIPTPAPVAAYLLAGGAAMSLLGAVLPIVDLPGSQAAISEAAWWPSGLLAIAALFAALTAARRTDDEEAQWRLVMRGSLLLVGAASYHSIILDAAQDVGVDLGIFSLGAFLPIFGAALSVAVAIIGRSHLSDGSAGLEVLNVRLHTTGSAGEDGAGTVEY
ncbi:MAG: hypothetical protein ACFCVK_14665 [Acidimicrobiales bacterium]